MLHGIRNVPRASVQFATLESGAHRALGRGSDHADDRTRPWRECPPILEEVLTDQFAPGVNCDGWVEMGTVDASTTGLKEVTIPDPTNFIQDGYTRFLLVDSSTFASSTGQQITLVRTNEDGTPLVLPRARDAVTSRPESGREHR